MEIISVDKHTVRPLDLGTWNKEHYPQFISWFANGKGLYVTALKLPTTTLLSVGLDGNVTVLREGHNWIFDPRPSPNGRLLAFSETEITMDAAMLENF